MDATEASANRAYRSQRAVIATVNGWLQQGRFAPGEPLPSTRDLAEELQVDRGTVRRGLTVLLEDGRLQRLANGRTAARSAPVGDTVLVIGGSDRGAPRHRSSGWSEAVAHGALDELHGAGRLALMVPPARADRAWWQSIADTRPAGAVIGDMSDAALARLLEGAASLPQRLPLAVYGDAPLSVPVDRVVSDHATGAALLVDWAVAQGCRVPVLALAGCAGESWAINRVHGFTAACARHGLAGRVAELPALPHGPDWEVRFKAAVRCFTAELAPLLTGAAACDGLFLATDHHVPAAAAAARRCHRRPGEDLWILGYDAYTADLVERHRESYLPPVSVDKRNRAAGEQLAALVLARAADPTLAPQRRLVAPMLVTTPAVPPPPLTP